MRKRRWIRMLVALAISIFAGQANATPSRQMPQPRPRAKPQATPTPMPELNFKGLLPLDVNDSRVVVDGFVVDPKFQAFAVDHLYLDGSKIIWDNPKKPVAGKLDQGKMPRMGLRLRKTGDYRLVFTFSYIDAVTEEYTSQTREFVVTNHDNREHREYLWVAQDLLDNSDFAKLVSEIQKKHSTPLEQARAAHKWVTENYFYNHSKERLPNGPGSEALNEFVSRVGACIGYSGMYASLVRALGIPTKLVMGKADGSSTHFWNEIFVDGAWRTVDTTWDSGNQYWGSSGGFKKQPGRSDHFNPDPSKFSQTHTKIEESSGDQ